MPRSLDMSIRNVDLFDIVRRLAYREVRGAQSQDEFRDWVLYQCCAHNSAYSPPLPDSEVRATARSIANWVWKRRDSIGLRWHRGILGLPPIRFQEAELRQDAVKIHQRAGAIYARGRRTLAVNAEIKVAVDRFNREGKRVTVTAIARWAHVSRMNVYRYQKETLGVSVGGDLEGLFSDGQQNGHFQGDTADPLTARGNPEASRFAANGVAGAAA
jgi:hypothetical protein